MDGCVAFSCRFSPAIGSAGFDFSCLLLAGLATVSFCRLPCAMPAGCESASANNNNTPARIFLLTNPPPKLMGTRRFQRAGFIISDIDRISEIMNPARWKRRVPMSDTHCFPRVVAAPRETPLKTFQMDYHLGS